MELYRVGGEEEPTLRGTLSEIALGDCDHDEPRWHLSANEPATRRQQRKAVRAWIQLPVLIPRGRSAADRNNRGHQ